MGDRVSIQFVNGEEKSPFLFSHWGGMDFVAKARHYVRRLKQNAKKEGEGEPLFRLEPGTVMIDFIREIAREQGVDNPITHDFYLTRNENEGDNSNNGNWEIDLGTTLAQDKAAAKEAAAEARRLMGE
jgi:hypothetical protein